VSQREREGARRAQVGELGTSEVLLQSNRKSDILATPAV